MKRKAFTIVELLVVIVFIMILSILTSVIIGIVRQNGPVVPYESSPGVWVFETYSAGFDTFAEDLSKFTREHPDLEITSQNGTNYREVPTKYVVTVKKKIQQGVE